MSAAKTDSVKVLLGPHHRVTIDGELRGPDEIVEVSVADADALMAEGYAVPGTAGQYAEGLEAIRAEQTPEEAERRRQDARRSAIHGSLADDSEEARYTARYEAELAKVRAEREGGTG